MAEKTPVQVILRGRRAFHRPMPISPTPTPKRARAAARGDRGVLSGTGLGASLAMHGAVLVSLTLAFSADWEAIDGGREHRAAELTYVAHAPVREPDPEPVPEPLQAEEELPTELDPAEVDLEPLELFEDEVEPEVPPPAPDPRFFEPSRRETPDRPLQNARLGRRAEAPQVAEIVPDAPPPPLEPAAVDDEPLTDAVEPAPSGPEEPAMPLQGECPEPNYPRIAQRRGWTGTVTLDIDITATGDVTDVRVVTSSGHDVLDEAAVEAVRRWRFAPAKSGGQPRATTARKRIAFTR